jgi:putative ABC transport system substrate-binding protein
MIGRRQFTTLLGGAAATWPLATLAQQAAKLPIIGLLGAGTAAGQSQWTAALVQRLRELGWSEGRDVLIEHRWADGHRAHYDEIAAELAPIGAGLVASLARPGGNVTGLSSQQADLAAAALHIDVPSTLLARADR